MPCCFSCSDGCSLAICVEVDVMVLSLSCWHGLPLESHFETCIKPVVEEFVLRGGCFVVCRWQACVNAIGNKGAWTREEDAKLIEVCFQYPVSKFW